MQIKRTWKKCDDPTIITIFNNVYKRSKELYPVLFETCTPKLYIDNSKSHLGKCVTQYSKTYYSKHELQKDINTNNIRYKDACIILSKYILHNNAKVLDVLCHEFGHFVSPASHHDYLWRMRANKIGQTWGITNERLDTSKVLEEGMEQQGVNKEQYKYIIECPTCHRQWKYKRICDTIRHCEKYICTKCKQNLIRIK